MDKLRIRLLDQLEIHYRGRRVDQALKKAKKSRKLMAYLLLLRGAPAAVHKLYDIFWEDTEIDNPESALKTLVSRTRAMFAEIDPSLREVIIAHTGAYSWNMDLVEEVDVFLGDVLTEELLASTVADKAFTQQFERLLCLYVGALLPEISHEDWVIVHALRLESRYRKTVLHGIALYREAGEYETVVRVCRMALVMLPFEEALHEELMRALVMLGRRNEAMMQYRHATDMHMKYMGVHPPSRIQNIYREIIMTDTKLEKDIDIISGELMEEDDDGGAFICDYGIFKDIYRLQIRSLERFHIASYLIITKVGSVNGTPVEPIQLDEIMQKLLKVLKAVLRRGDTITRYTASQYAILLQGPSPETISKIMDRIKMSFYRIEGHYTSTFEYLYVPLSVDGKESKK